MVNVSLLVKKEDIKGFEITGHADFDDYGKDIVCAGISTLVYTIINTIDQYTDQFEYSDNEELMRLFVDYKSIEVKVILNTFKTGIETLVQSYGDYVKLNYKEI